MDDREQGSALDDRTDRLDDDVAGTGREPSDGRPGGVPNDARAASEGRPSAVRHAGPGTTPPAEHAPTEDAVDRGETPDTEHQPGGDL